MARNTWSVCLKSDARFTAHRVWPVWIDQVARTRAEFAKFIEYDPMCNETASVGVLATAAARAKLLATSEYICLKRHADRRRRHRNARADLWVGEPASDMSWAFEAKQIKCKAGTRRSTLEAALDKARDDAEDLPDWEACQLFGLLIVTLPDEGKVDALTARLRALAASADFAWECGGAERPTFLYFRTT